MINPTCQGSLMNLVAQDESIRYNLNMDKGSSCYLHSIQFNDTTDSITIDMHAEKVKLLYLLFNQNHSVLNNIEFIKLYIQKNQVDYHMYDIPNWLLTYLVKNYDLLETYDDHSILNLDFLDKIYNSSVFNKNSAIQFKLILVIKYMNKQFLISNPQLIIKYKFTDTDTRKHILDKTRRPLNTFEHLTSHITNTTIINQLLSFNLIGSTLIIDLGKNNLPKVDNITITIKGCTLIELPYVLLKKHTNIIKNRFIEIPANLNPKHLRDIAYQYKYNNGFTFARGDYRIIIKLNEPLTNKINIASRTVNILDYNTTYHHPIQYTTVIKNPIPEIISTYPLIQINSTKFIEGYWFDENDSSTYKYPKPQITENIVDPNFIHKLIEVTDSAKFRQCLGLSHCRLCDKLNNGSKEYTIENDNIIFVYPQGLLHYYLDHNVQPSNEFYNFIMSI